MPRLSIRPGATGVDPDDRVTKAEVRDIAQRYLALFASPEEPEDDQPLRPEVTQYAKNLAAARKRKI